ncbi:hypothetical protein B0T26DRAFT_292201 [Lasiosphaeria miniovina]|uniref:Endoplasmic reticulum junction formation protein lunapark n=1 Tax=Lasiosphaeria miniovina TaxID=1954250 RepID=A0AA40AK36_9PEZI|nr:uncharacterized protein B0T26DRAFT_292201 [Lasiosphaeria miniovina]KAK0717254.1 hypothetical protein B0T26DRAFT_292201 [Lasiosphaeria miniovina]
MVSFWPWKRDDSSPASFEKTLSTLSTKIAATQAQLDKARATLRRVKVLSTLYLGFAYLVYTIVLLLVLGWQNMGTLEWTGVTGGPVLIYLVRAASSAVFNYRIDRLSARLEAHQTERAKTIQKLKDATKYDSTLELLEKYGGPENKAKKGKKKGGPDGDDNSSNDENRGKQGQGRLPNRTNVPPPPTANIQRSPIPSNLSTPQTRPRSALGTPAGQNSPPPEALDASAEFAPNAYDGRPPSSPASYTQYPPAPVLPAAESHWYDRILDTLLGEDETAAKNKIVLICGRCRLVNGQAPPGTKSLADLGTWKCMACGAVNGEMDEGKRIVQEVLGRRSAVGAQASAAATDDDDDAAEDAAGNSSDVIEVDKYDASSGIPEGSRRRKGKKQQN